jgi:hypothetical protein
MNRLTPRTATQREEVVLQRVRAIETGEFMEKVGLSEALGLAPPIGPNFIRGESTQDMRVRAAEAGIILPRMSPALVEAARNRAFERESGVQVQAAVTSRFKLSLARGGSQSSWSIPDLANVDYSGLNIAGVVTLPFLVLGVPQGTNAAKIGSPDAIGAAQAADSASRKTGAGSQVYFTVLSAWVYALNAAGTGIYNPAAGTTLQPFASSGVAAAGLKAALAAAAFNLNTNPAIWSQITLAAPADRAFAIGGPADPIAGIVNMFFGEALLAQLVTTGAVNILGNTLGAVFELA